MTISGAPEAIIQCVKQICVVMLEVQYGDKTKETLLTQVTLQYNVVLQKIINYCLEDRRQYESDLMY